MIKTGDVYYTDQLLVIANPDKSIRLEAFADGYLRVIGGESVGQREKG